MSDADKLRELIELAQEHGFWPEVEGIRVHWWGGGPPIVYTTMGDSYDTKLCEQFGAEQVLFDHEFVKALCKAKYGELNDIPDDRPFNGHDHYLTQWEYVLCTLALSTDRIGDLWGEFCGK